MASKYHDLIEVTPEIEAYVERSFKIADQIRHVLHEQGLKQSDLAEKLGKKESEISRMLCGTHNFTMKTIIRLEQVLGTQLLFTQLEVQAKEEQAEAATPVLRIVTKDETVPVEETVIGNWKEMVTHLAESSDLVPKRTSVRPSKKAAEKSAAFFEHLECVAC